MDGPPPWIDGQRDGWTTGWIAGRSKKAKNKDPRIDFLPDEAPNQAPQGTRGLIDREQDRLPETGRKQEKQARVEQRKAWVGAVGRLAWCYQSMYVCIPLHL